MPGRSFLLVLAAALLAATTAVAEAREWFVAAGASGTGAPDSPLGRIQDAVSVAQPGDVITIAAGTYEESLQTVRHGTPDAPITLRSDGARRAILTSPGRVLRVNHGHHVVEGLVLDGQYGEGVTLAIRSGGDAFVLRDSEVRRSGRDCINLGASRGVVIERASVHHCLNASGGRRDAHGIVAGAVRDLTVRETEIHTFSGDGLQLDPGRAAPGWTKVTLERCHIWLAPLPTSENGFPAGTVPGENAVDTKTWNDAPRAELVIRDTRVHGFRGGLIAKMAAFNLKENVDVTVDGVTVWASEIAFRLRGPTRDHPAGAWVAITERGGV